ncbi:hypothetical protein RI129_006566 [Pyrocoelia pectoralis]|uniref:Disks large-associated protein 5 n=1 Tax=Pyrocoelia pectoralis TaxID=417401 RepID=A0AAN7VGN1_9COLE
MVDVIQEMIPTSGSVSTTNSMKKRKNTKVAEETTLSSERRISTNNSMKKLKSPKAKMANLIPETIITQVEKIHTPIRLKNSPVIYISPFITISRGKENSRREYHERRSNFYESPTISALQKNTTPKAGATFFENLLREEERRLNELCSNWEMYENSENPPEEACDMIRMAIGQTKLLLRKKFGKFMELISECRCPTSEKMVTCLDLHGFWDITRIQINNLDGRFENLNRLKSTNWEEIVPPPLSKKQRKPKKNNVKKKEVKSSLRDLIKEQRKKNVLKENKNSPMIVVTTPRRRLSNILNTTFPQSDTLTPFNLRTNTPKSILKSGHFPKDRSIRKTKSVLFRESMGKENILESSNLIQFSPDPETSLHQYPRRSSRLAEKRINC